MPQNQGLQNKIAAASEAIQSADAIIITAGAGIGVDSGLPDFRGDKGFWNAYPAIAKLGFSFSEMANPHWFKQKPKLAWAFYGHRLNLYRKTTPHLGFRQLLDISIQKKGGYFVITSNIDGHFQKAGFDGNLINEIHGSINHLQCVKPCCDDIINADNQQVFVDEEKFEAQEPLPQCPNCSDLARPNILMFSDWLWISKRSKEQNLNFRYWKRDIQQNGFKPVIIEIGAGEAVPTIRFHSESLGKQFSATLIRINPRDHSAPEGSISIPLGGEEAIDLIYKKLHGH
ncbi:MAG: NAD-dependent deacetylase [Calditrichaeota bacterium]|nr:MAG: NAD-dependent deacetylase [Calditrichota bacterium]MBL1206066.1 NAD-dependent deacetylase [Calditrichota bacterium]NOG45893.1 NAD-dependent deacetylase [Calditrichota bacterium]